MQQIILKMSLLATALLFCVVAKAQNPDAISGIWWNAEKTAKIKVYEQNGEYFGKIIQLKEPNDEEGNPKTDQENPNDKLKKRALKGLVILSGLEYVGDGEYEDGEIYDPKSGKTYSCNAELIGQDQLDLRGYIGFSLIGRTSSWTRAEE